MPRYAAPTLQAQISNETPTGWAISADKSRDGLQGQIRAQVIALGTWEELVEMGVTEKSLWQGGKAR